MSEKRKIDPEDSESDAVLSPSGGITIRLVTRADEEIVSGTLVPNAAALAALASRNGPSLDAILADVQRVVTQMTPFRCEIRKT